MKSYSWWKGCTDGFNSIKVHLMLFENILKYVFLLLCTYKEDNRWYTFLAVKNKKVNLKYIIISSIYFVLHWTSQGSNERQNKTQNIIWTWKSCKLDTGNKQHILIRFLISHLSSRSKILVGWSDLLHSRWEQLCTEPREEELWSGYSRLSFIKTPTDSLDNYPSFYIEVKYFDE